MNARGGAAWLRIRMEIRKGFGEGVGACQRQVLYLFPGLPPCAVLFSLPR